jgi:hypothetical protein
MIRTSLNDRRIKTGRTERVPAKFIFYGNKRGKWKVYCFFFFLSLTKTIVAANGNKTRASPIQMLVGIATGMAMGPASPPTGGGGGGAKT